MAPNFTRGAAAAEEAAKKKSYAKSNVEFFSIKEEKENPKDVRFLTDLDEWITVDMHMQVPTRPAPAGYTGNWPKGMSAVCRKSRNDNGELVFPEYNNECYVCDHMNLKTDKGKKAFPRPRTWAVGILRQEVIEGGARVLKDATLPITVKDEKTGVETEVHAPVYEVFVFGWGNFWNPLQGIAAMKGTCLDRDYRITRKGYGMNDTDYTPGPHDPVMITLPVTDANGNFLYAEDGSMQMHPPRVLDMRDPEVLKYYPDRPDVADRVISQVDDNYYDRFFDVRHAQPEWSGGHDDAAPVETAKPSNDYVAPTPPVVQQAVAPTQVASIAQRLAGIPGIPGYSSNQAAPQG